MIVVFLGSDTPGHWRVVRPDFGEWYSRTLGERCSKIEETLVRIAAECKKKEEDCEKKHQKLSKELRDLIAQRRAARRDGDLQKIKTYSNKKSEGGEEDNAGAAAGTHSRDTKRV